MSTRASSTTNHPARHRLRHTVFAQALTDADLAAHLAKLAKRGDGASPSSSHVATSDSHAGCRPAA